ncbi:hypothetical protein KP509_12G006900 [Ceratopteris richardii]|uniref:Uncharacterized protein n=1 Tax=Ceratopteris richardii TaxID=49495 RepID=A0A8T2TIS0_CERRI|nr:hypothetical protein KP509_12G006900 [Ceratopteris richardii]
MRLNNCVGASPSKAFVGALTVVMEPAIQFFHDSHRFLRRCNRPDQMEFKSVAWRCAIGMTSIGLIGFLVKLFSIPVNQILLSSFAA